MNKNIVAAAVAAALAVPAMAQAEVTISGGLQAELRSIDSWGVGAGANFASKGLYLSDGGMMGSTSSQENGGNYGFLKFSADENLGGGLKALAVYDMNISIGDTGSVSGNTNGTNPTGREAYVGLAGGWGAVLAGTLPTPYKSSTVDWDPFLATSLQARGNGGMSALQSGYASNALAYVNTFNGVKVEAAIVFDEATNGVDGTKTNGKNSLSFSVNAPLGPVELAVAYIDLSKNSDLIQSLTGLSATSAATADNLDATKVGLKWHSGAWTVAGQLEQLGKGYSADNKSHNMAYATASYAVGRNTFSAGYGTADTHLYAFAVGNASVSSSYDNRFFYQGQNVTYTMIGMNHAFSKTVNAFVGYQATSGGTKIWQNTVSLGLRVGF